MAIRYVNLKKIDILSYSPQTGSFNEERTGSVPEKSITMNNGHSMAKGYNTAMEQKQRTLHVCREKRSIMSIVLWLAIATTAHAADWPMAGANPQHTMHSSAPVPANPRIVWQTRIDSAVYAGPAIAGHTIYIAGHDKQVWALNVANGAVRWKQKLGDEISTTPAIMGNTIVVGAKDGILTALDTQQGKIKWQTKTGQRIISSPVIDQNTVFVGSNDLYLYGIDLTNGEVLWRYLTEGYKYSGLFCSPTVDAEKIYIGTKNGKFYAVYRDSGKFVWKREVGSSVYRAALLEEDRLYISSYDRRVYALNTLDGTIAWRTFLLDDWPMGTPVLINGILYVGGIL